MCPQAVGSHGGLVAGLVLVHLRRPRREAVGPDLEQLLAVQPIEQRVGRHPASLGQDVMQLKRWGGKVAGAQERKERVRGQ